MTKQQSGWEQLPPVRRELYLRIIDGHPAPLLHHIAHRLHFLDNHFPPQKLDKGLVWLVANNFIGTGFLNWFQVVCKGSDLEMHRLLLAIIENDVLKPVIAGKDFKL